MTSAPPFRGYSDPSGSYLTDAPDAPHLIVYDGASVRSEPYAGAATRLDRNAALALARRQFTSDRTSLTPRAPVAALRTVSIDTSDGFGPITINGVRSTPITYESTPAWVIVYPGSVPEFYGGDPGSSVPTESAGGYRCIFLVVVGADSATVLTMDQLCG